MEDGIRSERILLRRLVPGRVPIEPDSLRAELRRAPVQIDVGEGLRLPPPGEESPLEELPLFHDERHGIVVFRSVDDDEYELLSVPESGGPSRSLGQYPAGEPVPSLEPGATRRLEGYLAYVLDRDASLWSTYQELRTGASHSLEEALGSLRSATANEVVVRASVRSRLRGKDGIRLTVEDLDRGIRAMDGDMLDRPTLGRVL